jgi:transcriptional regulator with XRE-family HTH domain
MTKSIFSKQYRIFLRHLRAARQRAGLTQDELAERLGQTQSFISKCERGERRLDIVEVKISCRALGIRFSKFSLELEKVLEKKD